VTVQQRDVAKLIVSLPLVGDDPAEPSIAWCCAVCGNELAMIVATGSDKNDEELAINRVAGSENDAVSPACTICAECETYYEKMYEMPETNSTTTCSSCGSECTKCTRVLSSVIFPIVKIVALFASDVFQKGTF
jgi:hypothetical protein